MEIKIPPIEITKYMIYYHYKNESDIYSDEYSMEMYNQPEIAKSICKMLNKEPFNHDKKYAVYKVKLTSASITKVFDPYNEDTSTKSCWYIYNRKYHPIRDIDGNDIDNLEEQLKLDYEYFKSLNIEDDSYTIINEFIPTSCDFIVYAHNKRFGFIEGVDAKKISDVVRIVRQFYYKSE